MDGKAQARGIGKNERRKAEFVVAYIRARIYKNKILVTEIYQIERYITGRAFFLFIFSSSRIPSRVAFSPQLEWRTTNEKEKKGAPRCIIVDPSSIRKIPHRTKKNKRNVDIRSETTGDESRKTGGEGAEKSKSQVVNSFCRNICHF